MSSYSNGAVISCGDKTSVALLASHIGSCYKLSKICDLVIVTGDDKAVFCHKLVLCSLSRTLLDICVGEESGNETTCVYLPDFSYEAVKALVDKIYESMGKQLVEIARTELTAILGVEDVPLTSYFKTEGVPDRYSVKIECDPDKVIIENEKVTESHGTEDKEEGSDHHEEIPTKRRRGRPSAKRQCYKETCDDDKDDDDYELEESMQDIFQAAKNEMGYDGEECDTGEEWQPEFEDINEGEVFKSGEKDEEKRLKEEIKNDELPLKSKRGVNRKWQPKEYKHDQYARYGQDRTAERNANRKRERIRSISPDEEKPKRPRRARAKKTQHQGSESEKDSNDDGDYIPDLKKEQDSSDEEQPANDYSSHQGKAIKNGIRVIVSECKPIQIDVRSAGGDFHIIPAESAHKIRPNGSKANRSKIDFTYKQYMVKPSFAAIVGVARAGDSEDLIGKPLAWSYPSGEEEMNSQYNAVTNAYRQVYGFSEEDVHCNKTFIIAHFGSYKDVPNEYRDPKRAIGKEFYSRYKRMYKQDPAALHCELEQRKEDHPAYERKEKLPTLTLHGTRCQLKFDSSLDTKDFEGIMLVAWHVNKIRPSESSYRKAIGKVLNFDCDILQNKFRLHNPIWEQPPKVLDLFMRTLRDVWMNGSTWLPFSQHMFHLFKTVFERACAPRLLSNIIAGNLPERMCTECGKTFTVLSAAENSVYKKHMEKHAIEKSFHLDCGCTNVRKIRSTKARDRHMKLYHSDGRFVKCRKCVEVVEKDKLEDHMAKNHVDRERFCEVCGKSCPHT